ncbi:uncharacterized protein E0L32_007589 [Thyridium curvatum]|uniref:Transcription factor domain-containing protein n=1 Tax=Thyridium curvatum TaxID=1093900 RepID=A0A507B4T9_9PEZI|nr:uncharacterized protein E0L32_007589 [Thyridium curvatum]TPX11610.1 hypothetical protein E0L32_007589 [Thyridium curvatum]
MGGNLGAKHAQLAPPLVSTWQRRQLGSKANRNTPKQWQTDLLFHDRKKYWDEEYVRSLEDQIALLTSLSLNSSDQPSVSVDPHLMPFLDLPAPLSSSPALMLPLDTEFDTSRFSSALCEFASLDWNVKYSSNKSTPGFQFTGSVGRFSIPFRKTLPTFEEVPASSLSETATGRPEPLTIATALDADLKSHLKDVFLNHINSYYRFVNPQWLMFTDVFPENDTVLQFMYSAIFAVASHISSRTGPTITECLLDHAEKMAMECCREHLCLPVTQTLLILAWYKHTILATAHGYMYHYMSIGLSTHLGVLDQRFTMAAEVNIQDMSPTITTLWALFVTDRVATPTLGFKSSIPWDITKIPRYISTVTVDETDVTDLTFEAHCRLLELQQQHLDAIYAFDFQTRPPAERLSAFCHASSALTLFRSQIDPRLLITRTSTPHTAQLVFWIYYHCAILNLHRPFISPRSAPLLPGHDPASSFTACSAAADAITKLASQLPVNEHTGAIKVPPYIVYCVMRAATVQGINMLGPDARARAKAASQYRACRMSLCGMAKTWPVPGLEILEFLQEVMRKWDLHAIMGELIWGKCGIWAISRTLTDVMKVREMAQLRSTLLQDSVRG